MHGSTTRPILLIFIAVALTLIMSTAANAAAEKGPRCSDGIDNDGDSLIDADDPNCGGGASEYNLPQIFDSLGQQVGSLRLNSISHYDAGVFYALPNGSINGLYLTRDRIIGLEQAVYPQFLTDDCMGDAYIENYLRDPPEGFQIWVPTSPIAVFSDSSGHAKLSEYLIGDGNPTTITALSYLRDEQCFPNESGQDMVAEKGIPLDAGLDEFVPPFTPRF